VQILQANQSLQTDAETTPLLPV